MERGFRTYHLAVCFYRLGKQVGISGPLRNQFERASSSIVLNLAEGSGKRTRADRRRFYYIALGSVRECEAVVELLQLTELAEPVDQLARHLYKLCRALE